MPERWRGSIVTTAVTLFLGFILLVLLFGSGLRPLSVTALSLFCGGSASNLLDRVAFGGSVVDFLSLGWDGFRTCVFNVADAAIVTGAALFLLSVLVWSVRSFVSKMRVRPTPGALG